VLEGEGAGRVLAGEGVALRIEAHLGRADRDAANPALCSCVQRVANGSLSTADQRRAAEFFANPDKAEQVRRSDATRDDEFWERYRAFASRAEAVCG
jgi:hypothetical protein